MGSCGSKSQVDEPPAVVDVPTQTLRALLLGTFDSGKTTLSTQLEVRYGGECPEETRLEWIPAIHGRIYTDIYNALRIWQDMKEEPLHEKLQPAIDVFQSPKPPRSESGRLPQALCDHIRQLWADPTFHASFQRFSRNHPAGVVQYFAAYFLEHADRIFQPRYIPSIDDIIRVQLRSYDVCEASCTYRPTTKLVVHTGTGLKDQTKKWNSLYQHQFAVVAFVVALGDYDMVLGEHDPTNRLHAALDLFEQVCALPHFANTPLLLVFNKLDVFYQKITRIPLTKCFPEYAGAPNDSLACREYVQAQFESRNRVAAAQREFQVCFISALDPQAVNGLFQQMETIINRQVKS
eukprot:TRINITY_DN4322_c0_g5_i2.p1 TRINITY_DN4322_c0_g5~~TRINITY_DN4322_c0_g5_i2.p1  ORF type:complete len:349 (+),score=59.66 TRINITY_DN4322_c0_g5_i2:103-1149(+)